MTRSAARRRCYHCGDPVPAGTHVAARIGGAERDMCCAGCKAVAELIETQGLGSFYAHREPPGAGSGPPPIAPQWSRYDGEALSQRYLHVAADGTSVSLDIGGMYCSACVWLLETALRRRAAIRDLSVNPATRRAVVRWDAEQLPFSALLAAIAELGFDPQPVVAGSATPQRTDDQRLAMRRLLVAAIAGMQVMMFAVALYAGGHYGIDGRIREFLRVLSLLVCVPIVFYSARPFFVGALRGLRARMPGMDVPVALAILIAFVASAYHALRGTGEIYFDSVAMFVLFLSATRYLEMRVRRSADDTAQALARLLPESVVRLRGERREAVPLDAVCVDDLLSVKAGDVVPVDGRIVSGELLADESVVSGESAPVLRRCGGAVVAGSINRAGNAVVRVEKTGAATSIAEIGRLLERAQADRPRIAILADRVASRFVVAMLVVAAVTGFAWSVLDPSRAFETILATLVVTCPCALALATPAALAAATSRLAECGLLVVRSRVLERLALPATLVFDKTGTLTRGQPAVADTVLLPHARATSVDAALRIAAAVERESEHVLARAFAEHDAPDRHRVRNARSVLGCGIEAEVDGTLYRVGSPAFVNELCGGDAGSGPGDALTEVQLGDRSGPIARFLVADALRPHAREALDRLRALGHRIVIASGDRAEVVAQTASELGVDDWHAGLTPADKLELVGGLRRGGANVVAVGDGINDAPILAGADASIAVNAGTALARASADSILLGSRLGTIPRAAEMAAATRRVIRQNVAWALAYNATAVPLAATGVLAPWMAAIGMSASSLLVVMNALRLRRRALHATAAASSWSSGSAPTEAPA